MDVAKISVISRTSHTDNNMKIIPSKTKLFTVLLAMASSILPAHRAQAEKPASVAPAAAEVELAIKAAKKEQVRHSMIGQRNTLLFYTFDTQKIVLALHIDNKNSALLVSGTLHIFNPDVTVESLHKWVNNQHSDARFIDAANPELSLKLPDETFTVTERKRVGQEKQHFGDEVLGDYQIKITAKEHRVEGKYRLAAFTDVASVFIKDGGTGGI